MSKRISIQPYKTAGVDSVIWGGWKFSEDDSLSRLVDHPPAWDPVTELWITGSVKVHRGRFLAQTGLQSMTGLSLVAVVETPRSFFRGIDVQPLRELPDQDELVADVVVHLPAGSCAPEMKASMHVILTEESQNPTDPIAPNKMGSKLAASGSETFNLDPQSPLFPTEAMAFSGLLPAGVPWYLSVIYDELDDAFYGAVRLYVNTEHPGGRAALAADSTDLAVRSSLRVDIVRSLFQQVSVREGFEISEKEYPGDSLGGVLSSMSSWYFRSTLKGALQLLRLDPLEFDSRLQAALEYMRGV